VLVNVLELTSPKISVGNPEAHPELDGLHRHDQPAASRERSATMRWLVLRLRGARS
jgi:hypothetical protein